MTTLGPTLASGSTLAQQVNASRRRRLNRQRLVIAGLLVALLAMFALTLMLGQSFVPPGDVWRVLLGEDVPGASFTVGRLRLPRAVLSVLAGLSFGLAGSAFQTMLRNTLASPDIIGISYSASAAAVVGIVFFSLSGPAVSTASIVASLCVAVAIYVLSFKRGVNGTRLILVGIGVAALLESVVAYTLSEAGEWNMQEAIRWLSGTVNGATWGQIGLLLTALPLLGAVLWWCARDLEALRLGDDLAGGLGVRVTTTRLLVLVADYVGQFLLPSRYPVGVITGALGASFLIYLIVRSNRLGAG